MGLRQHLCCTLLTLSTRENLDPGRLAEHLDMFGMQLVFRF